MRTLNRPMFRMGGPIKEGVMHGIREPRKEGGRIGFQFGSKGWHIPTATGVTAAAAGTVIPPATGRIAGAIDKAKKAQSFLQNPKFSERYLLELGKKYIPKAARGILGAAKWGLGRFPAVTTALGGEYVTRPKAWEKEMDIGRWDKLKRDFTPWYGTQEKIKQYQDWKELQAKKLTDQATLKQTEKGIPGGGDPRMTYTDPDKAKKLANQKKDKRVNDLLEIMGYDKAKKTAAYDALIDTSQIISAAPGGKDLDISRDIIQPAIGAASKRFDKPQQIEEAVRLMMVKGDIEKDIASGKSGTQLKAAQDYAAMKKISLDKAYKELGFTKKGNIGETVTAVAKQYGVSGANSDVLDSSLRILEETPPIMKIKADNKLLKEFKEANQGESNIELEFVDTQIKEKEPGYYIVDKRIVEVDESGDISYYY